MSSLNKHSLNDSFSVCEPPFLSYQIDSEGFLHTTEDDPFEANVLACSSTY